MAKTVVRENESFLIARKDFNFLFNPGLTQNSLLRRFKRQVSRTGTLAEARKREFYVKPGLKRKLKSEAARKNNKKR